MVHITTLLLQQSIAHLPILVAIIALSSFLYVIIGALLDPLRQVQGPFWARFSRLWLVRQVSKQNMHETQIKLHEQYGYVVRLAPNQYSISDTEAVKQIYGHGGQFPKSDFYLPFGDGVAAHDNIFNERDEKLHGQKRRRIANLYSLSTLLSYEAFVDENNSTLTAKLAQMAQRHESFSVGAWMQYYAFDVIGSITVGQPFKFLENGGDTEGIFAGILKVRRYGTTIGTFWASLHPYVAKFGPWVGYSIPRQFTLNFIFNNIRRKRDLVEQGETTEDHTGKQDFLEKLFVLEAKGKVDELDVINTMSNNINAGSDTTATSLSAILYELITHPIILANTRKEISEAREANQVSEPISFKEAQDLPYLQAVIKEALRLHPAVGQILPRVVPKPGAHIANHYFPGGTIVGINPWVLHRSVEVFGPDADVFRPERWLESKEKSAEMDHYNLTFGAGARTCIGRHISMLEINKVIPVLITKFDFELEDPGKGIEVTTDFLAAHHFRCFVKERSM